MGKNKGKKYIKLRGGEVATPENEARAKAFLAWYAANTDEIRQRLIYSSLYDDEVATDTMLNIYDCIAYKGLAVLSPKFYFLRSYHTNYRAAQIKRQNGATMSLEAPVYNTDYVSGADYLLLRDTLAASTFDSEAYEMVIDELEKEMTEYVRANYDPADCSLFEIYIALYPDMTYEKLAAMLGFTVHRIWPVIGAIKKDLTKRFANRASTLLSWV